MYIMDKRTIVFKQGEENGVVIEREQFEYSIFLNQYQQAIDAFQRLWKSQQALKASNQFLSHSISLDNQISNIIAFCGDRGEGKSSCMSTFANILTDSYVRNNARSVIQEPEDMLGCQDIEWLDMIDPSFFDTKHNLLELLLGRMYAKIASVMSDNTTRYNDCESVSNHRKLMEQFQKVKKDVTMIERATTAYDSLEEISDLAAGVNLKSDIQKLFEYYLKFLHKKCLLLCIDDIDLNISEGYKMAEMLRKYLICPQCIILVAVKVEQLVEVVATAHMNEVKNTKITWDDCQQMAQKYVTKLLPRSNRVAMPVFAEICEYRLKIADLNNNTADLRINDISVKERVVQLIFQKTGYVFYNAQSLSRIVPRNLRELRHLLSTLDNLPDAKDVDGRDNEMGREVFKEYFFETWILNLSSKDQKFAHQLASYDNITTLNAFVVEYFSNRVKEGNIEIKAQANTKVNKEEDSDTYAGDYAPLYLDIINRTNTSTNISFGDVMYVLWFVNTITVNEDIHNLIFFIKTVYSIRLYAYYNEITADKDNTLFPEVDYTQTHISIHKADRMYDRVNRLQRMVNGSYFSYPSGALLAKNQDNYIIDFKKIREELFDRLKGAIKNRTTETDAEFIRLLNMCEYFALTISFASNIDNIEKENFCRTSKTPTFIGVHSHTASRALFDFLNPFYAITNIKYAYHRFDEILSDAPTKYLDSNVEEQNRLYNIALNEENSILSRLKSIGLENYDDGWDIHGCISDAIIRVVDIQWAIFEELLRLYRTHRKGGAVNKMRLAYDDIQSLGITLYPKIIIKNNEIVHTSQAHEIEFKFLGVLNEIHKEYESQIEEYLTSLNKQIEIERFMTPGQFLNQLTQKIQRLRTWPREGKKLRREIVTVSGLIEGSQNLFDLSLRSVFEDRMMYEREDVENKQTNMVAAYVLATRENKD